MIGWLSTNENWLSLIVAFLSLIITSVLTIAIIVQTSKLAKKQAKQELVITKQQENLQKHQIKIDTFEYKNRIYHAVYRVFQMTGEIETIYQKIDLSSKSMIQLNQLFETYREQLRIDTSETLWLFKQSEYVLSSHIFSTIEDIATNFDELTGDIAKFKLFATILTEEEIEIEKNNLLSDILLRSKRINSYVMYINAIMPEELNISRLDK